MSDNILKQYFVRVETINDKNPVAKEIRFNNLPIWTDIIGTLPNSEQITNVEANNVHMNPRIIKSDNTMMTGIRDITDKESFVFENPLDKTKKNIPLNNAKPQDTDDMRYDDIYTNNEVDNNSKKPVSIVDPNEKIQNLEQNKKLLNSIPRAPNSFMKDTALSLARKKEILNRTDTKKQSNGGRKSTRKNKKKTKTMRRKRRNL